MSNVIKMFQYVSLDNKMIVETAAASGVAADQQHDMTGVSVDPLVARQAEELKQLELLKEQIVHDAESFAEEQIRAATEEAAAIRQQVQAEIEQWWEERRLSDKETVSAAREEGFRHGYKEGLEQAEAELRDKYDGMLLEAAHLLEQAHIIKQQVIQDSEPFLIEMSCAIAEKIIGRQLTIEPGWITQYIGKVLERRREKGIITLCVSPANFSHILDAREELLLHIDSQAELAIIPDPSVHDHGCVVRSSFGSIDARMDTQLNEIKNALQQLAVRQEE